MLTQPAYLASQVSKYGRRYLEEVLRDRGLGLVHHAVLRALDDLGALSQQEMAASLDLDKSHLVAPLDGLEQRGLVKRARDPSDRRRNEVTLTPLGKALLHELDPVGRRSQESFLDALSAAEQKTLVTLLQRVLAANDATRLDGTRGR